MLVYTAPPVEDAHHTQALKVWHLCLEVTDWPVMADLGSGPIPLCIWPRWVIRKEIYYMAEKALENVQSVCLWAGYSTRVVLHYMTGA